MRLRTCIGAAQCIAWEHGFTLAQVTAAWDDVSDAEVRRWAHVASKAEATTDLMLAVMRGEESDEIA